MKIVATVATQTAGLKDSIMSQSDKLLRHVDLTTFDIDIEKEKGKYHVLFVPDSLTKKRAPLVVKNKWATALLKAFEKEDHIVEKTYAPLKLSVEKVFIHEEDNAMLVEVVLTKGKGKADSKSGDKNLRQVLRALESASVAGPALSLLESKKGVAALVKALKPLAKEENSFSG